MKFSFNIIKNSLNIYFRNPNIYIQKRNLFSSELLGIENYLRQKDIFSSRVGSVRDKFMEKMKIYVANSENDIIFADDLKMAIYLVETDQEIETIFTMIKKYHKQMNKEAITFSTFKFGPLIMRFLHLLNKPDEARDLFFDQEMTDFFNQVSSYITFMDLMFINGYYNDVIKAMDHLQINNSVTHSNILDCLMLYFAACCKLNAKESLDLVIKQLKKIKETNPTIPMRIVIYGAMLAINQNQPTIALDILAMIHIHKIQNPPLVFTNIKLLTLTKLEKFDEAILILKNSQQSDVPVTSITYNCEIFSDILAEVKSEFDRKATKSQQSELEYLIKGLERFNRIDSRSFEAYIFSNIEKRRSLQTGFKHRPRSQFYADDGDKARRTDARPHLRLLDNRLK